MLVGWRSEQLRSARWTPLMISLPRPRSPVFLRMARSQGSPLQHGSMAKIKIASVSVMQRNGNQPDNSASDLPFSGKMLGMNLSS
jgi:hypothetical protein